jgi:hypothetical protein
MYARSIGPALPCGMGSHMPPPGSASWLHTVQSTPSTPAELYTHPAKVASTTPSQVDGPPGSDFSWQLDTPPKHAPQASRLAPLRPPPLAAQLSRERDRAVEVGVPHSHLMFRDLLCSQLRDPEVRSAAPRRTAVRSDQPRCACASLPPCMLLARQCTSHHAVLAPRAVALSWFQTVGTRLLWEVTPFKLFELACRSAGRGAARAAAGAPPQARRDTERGRHRAGAFHRFLSPATEGTTRVLRGIRRRCLWH